MSDQTGMTRGKKIAGLIIILAIPVLILLFLENFGEQHYQIPADPREAEGLSASVPAPYLRRDINFPTSLIDDQGNAIQPTSHKIAILYLMPPDQPDSASLLLEQLTRVQNIFEDEMPVQLLTVVPTDEPDSLLKLKQRYRAQPGQWQFLADTAAQTGRSNLLPPGVPVSTLVLVDQAQQARGYYDGSQEKEIDRLVAETRILLHDVK